MKKFYLLTVCLIFLSNFGQAQCSINSSMQTVPGANPTADFLPCVIRGVAYNETVQGQIPASYDTTITIVVLVQAHFVIDSMRMDSITGLPTGITWSKNPNVLLGGGNGCINFSGTTNDTVGRYYITGWGTIWTHMQASAFGQYIDTPYVYTGSLNQLSPFGNYYLDVINNGSACHSPNMAVTLGTDQTVCNNTFVTLNSTIVNGHLPYTYSWNATGNSLSCYNCQNPTATITQTSTYTVTVTDANNLTATAQVIYSVAGNNFQISASGPTTFCQGGSVTLNAGSGYTSYHWSDNSSNSTLTATQSGTYFVTVTSLGGCTFTNSISVTANTPTISNYQITANGATSFCNGGSVTLNAGAGFTTYHWSNSSSSQTITVSQTGNYTVTVIGTDGCTYSDGQSVNTNTTFNGQTVCIVSVDQITGKNVIVWEKTGGLGIDSFKVYKETNIANQYQLIREQPYGNFSTYEDGQSNPTQQSDRYVITVVDACGESSYSSPHRTIHLTSNVGLNNVVNLIWNAYEGFSYPSFNVYRGSSQSNMQILTTVSSGTLSYTDLTPPSPPLYYQIEVINPQGCVPTAKTEDYSSSLSNVVQITASGINAINNDNFSLRSVYDEQTGNNILQVISPDLNNVKLKIYDYSGREVYSIANIEHYEITLPDFVKGVYIAEAMRNGKVFRLKIVVR